MENGNVPKAGSAAKVKDFTDLEAWKIARELRKQVCQICKVFPKEEAYVLGAQTRRAAISITANIAEGYGRYSFQENIQFCRQSRASAYELRDHLTTALDAGYIGSEQLARLNDLATSVIKLLNGYIRATQNRKSALPVQRRSH
jgi:four helix bundle protein